MTFKCYVIEKVHPETQKLVYWSRTKARWLASPADGGTFEKKEDAEELAKTSGYEGLPEREVIDTKKNKRILKPVAGHPPGQVKEVTIKV